MNLYKLSENGLQQLAHEDFALEKEIQTLIEKNISTLFNVKFVSSEFSIGEFRIDTLCFDEEANAFVIVEYKRGNSYSVRGGSGKLNRLDKWNFCLKAA